MNTYKIRQAAGKKGDRRGGAEITVPWNLAKQVPPDTEFIPELTEEGLLFRRVDPADRPSWAGGS